MLYQTGLTTPLGELQLQSNGHALTALTFTTNNALSQRCAILDEAKRQLKAYFLGQLTCFDLPLQPSGTLFQEAVWRQLQQIPFGHVVSYKEIAEQLQNPKAMRAVGMANRNNPIGIIIPCHRVIGANHKLVGYASGLPHKEWLLRHEGSWP